MVACRIHVITNHPFLYYFVSGFSPPMILLRSLLSPVLPRKDKCSGSTHKRVVQNIRFCLCPRTPSNSRLHNTSHFVRLDSTFAHSIVASRRYAWPRQRHHRSNGLPLLPPTHSQEKYPDLISPPWHFLKMETIIRYALTFAKRA